MTTMTIKSQVGMESFRWDWATRRGVEPVVQPRDAL